MYIITRNGVHIFKLINYTSIRKATAILISYCVLGSLIVRYVILMIFRWEEMYRDLDKKLIANLILINKLMLVKNSNTILHQLY